MPTTTLEFTRDREFGGRKYKRGERRAFDLGDAAVLVSDGSARDVNGKLAKQASATSAATAPEAEPAKAEADVEDGDGEEDDAEGSRAELRLQEAGETETVVDHGPPCEKCGQIDVGQQGEYPCSACGLPTVWDGPAGGLGPLGRSQLARAKGAVSAFAIQHGQETALAMATEQEAADPEKIAEEVEREEAKRALHGRSRRRPADAGA